MEARLGISAIALIASIQAAAAQEQTAPADTAAQAEAPAPAEDGQITVTGIRGSLEKAAAIKKDAIQVVDSIVAQDIGKFPDPTTAAALQRVPGVQVQYDRGNELGSVRIRGLPDTLTTVNGREVFTATGRNFNLQDLPAEALARVDVVKSQTADLIEGGLAGNIDLQLNRPFNFRKPTVVINARGNYGARVNEINPQFGALVTDRWNTGIGEMGLLVNGTWSKTYSYQPESTMADPRTTATAPLNTGAATNYILPSIFQNISQSGLIWHSQVNASYQWQVSPAVQFYMDGLYASTVNKISYSGGGNLQPYTTNSKISDIVASPDDCYTARFNAAGQNAPVVTGTDGQPYIIAKPVNATDPLPYTVQNLCFVRKATISNAVINQTTHADNFNTRNKMVAGGLNYEVERARASIDVAYQTSNNYDESVTADVGQRLPTVYIDTDVDGEPRLTIPGDYLSRRDTLYLRNSISQNYQKSDGSLFAASAKGSYELDSILKKLEFGIRYADRSARYQQYRAVTALPAGFGNLGTASEATAKRVIDLPLPADFLEFGPAAPAINGGESFLVPSADFLRSERGRDILRGIFKLPLGKPAYDPTRQFDASEKVLASYAQANYSIPFGGDVKLDGVLGLRVARTDRDVTTFRAVTTGGVTSYVPVANSETDIDILPNASARLALGGGIQLRATYAKTVRRPDFTLLNPSLQLTISPNPFLVNTGSAGNPDLQPQKSDSFDVSAEYYIKNGYIAVTGYYRKLRNRVINSPSSEVIGGVTYSVTRPRNVGEAALKGVEVSGQVFFDFLPGALSGLGAFGAFTYADTEIQGNDVLVGNPLQGVSKYNYTAGMLYEKYGLSGRVVYTYRSEAWQEDQTGSLALRPIDPARANVAYVPVMFRWMRPNGRLDFSLGYDLNDNVRIDVGGTNITRQKNQTYWGVPFANSQTFAIETTYTVGVRVKL
nr:TonB-dependent receptor [Sphingomonas sp. R-74633]